MDAEVHGPSPAAKVAGIVPTALTVQGKRLGGNGTFAPKSLTKGFDTSASEPVQLMGRDSNLAAWPGRAASGRLTRLPCQVSLG
jgi:hypothetical protein